MRDEGWLRNKLISELEGIQHSNGGYYGPIGMDGKAHPRGRQDRVLLVVKEEGECTSIQVLEKTAQEERTKRP